MTQQNKTEVAEVMKTMRESLRDIAAQVLVSAFRNSDTEMFSLNEVMSVKVPDKAA